MSCCARTSYAAHLQDIVTAHEHFNMDGFVGQFQTALQVTSPKKRMFLLDWMGVSLPDFSLIQSYAYAEAVGIASVLR